MLQIPLAGRPLLALVALALSLAACASEDAAAPSVVVDPAPEAVVVDTAAVFDEDRTDPTTPSPAVADAPPVVPPAAVPVAPAPPAQAAPAPEATHTMDDGTTMDGHTMDDGTPMDHSQMDHPRDDDGQ